MQENEKFEAFAILFNAVYNICAVAARVFYHRSGYL
jgi:hypothetical protein